MIGEYNRLPHAAIQQFTAEAIERPKGLPSVDQSMVSVHTDGVMLSTELPQSRLEARTVAFQLVPGRSYRVTVEEL